MTLWKDTQITERVKFRLEGQAFNFLTTPFFRNPNTSVTSSSFGTDGRIGASPDVALFQITGLYSRSASRNIQVAARTSF